MSDEFIIETEHLSKTFPLTNTLRAALLRKRKTVLQDVNLQIRPNEIFGLLGPNGAGKTTIIKILCTLIRPNGGTARVCGHDVVGEGAKVRGQLGLVNCDDRSHFWRLTGRQNMEFYAALSNVPARETRKRIDELLELTGLSDAASTRLSEYSSGMKQRLAIARGLLHAPAILFMDEPSRSLDPIGAHDIRTFIRDRVVNQAGRTVVLATNLMDEAEFLCDRVALFNQGQLLAIGSIEELGYALHPDRHYRLVVRGLTGADLDSLNGHHLEFKTRSSSLGDGASQVNIWAPDGSGLAQAMHTIVEMGGEVWDCERINVTLQEVFRAMLADGDNPQMANRLPPSDQVEKEAGNP